MAIEQRWFELARNFGSWLYEGYTSKHSGIPYAVIFEAEDIIHKNHDSLVPRGFLPFDDFDIVTSEERPNILSMIYHINGTIEQYEEKMKKIDWYQLAAARIVLTLQDNRWFANYVPIKQK